ncbi:MAG: heme exporter protein CcmB [Burkholderiaceae bacterium]
MKTPAPDPISAGAPAAAGMVRAMRGLVARDLRLALRRRADPLSVLVFFVLVASLFPLGVGPEPDLLRTMGPGVVFVAALLAAMLSLGRMFADDYQDGTLEQLLLSACPLPLLVAAKIAAHWICSGLLLALVSPLLALQFDLGWPATGVLFLALLVVSPLLSLIGAVGAALTVGVRGAAVLMPLLILPLCVPALIFGTAAVEASRIGMDSIGHFSLLGAFLVLALVGAPWATATALRIALE